MSKNLTATSQTLITAAASATADVFGALVDANGAVAAAAAATATQYQTLAVAVYGDAPVVVNALAEALKASVTVPTLPKGATEAEKAAHDQVKAAAKAAVPTSATMIKYWALVGRASALPTASKDTVIDPEEIRSLVVAVSQPIGGPTGFSATDALKKAGVPYGIKVAEGAILPAATAEDAVNALKAAAKAVKSCVAKAVAEHNAASAKPKAMEHYLKATAGLITKAAGATPESKADAMALVEARIAELEAIKAAL